MPPIHAPPSDPLALVKLSTIATDGKAQLPPPAAFTMMLTALDVAVFPVPNAFAVTLCVPTLAAVQTYWYGDVAAVFNSVAPS